MLRAGLLAPLVLSACHASRPTEGAGGPTPRSAARCAPPTPASGLDLIVLGSGGPRAAGRAASSYLLRVDSVPRVLVDVGPGSSTRLGETGVPTDALGTVLLTHLHIDHAGDLPGFVKSRDLLSDGPVGLRIFGPTGRGPYPSTTVFVERLFGREGAFAYLRSFRNELRFELEDIPVDLDAKPRSVRTDDGLTLSAVGVDHGEVPALAWRIEHAGRSVVITGDLASKRGRLDELVRGADLLVYDTAVLDPPGSPANLYELHTPPEKIGEVAAAAGVKQLVLGHIPPQVDENRAAVLAAVRRRFKGDVRFAHDCQQLTPGASR